MIELHVYKNYVSVSCVTRALPLTRGSSQTCWMIVPGDNTLKLVQVQHAFTKLAVSQLIMVRFEKFKIWHAQGSDADLSDVTKKS